MEVANRTLSISREHTLGRHSSAFFRVTTALPLSVNAGGHALASPTSFGQSADIHQNISIIPTRDLPPLTTSIDPLVPIKSRSLRLARLSFPLEALRCLPVSKNTPAALVASSDQTATAAATLWQKEKFQSQVCVGSVSTGKHRVTKVIKATKNTSKDKSAAGAGNSEHLMIATSGT